MAERDRFEKRFGAGWLSAYRYGREGMASIEEICDKLIQSLAKTLREQHGIPNFEDLAHVISHSDPSGLLDAFAALDEIVRNNEGHRHCKIAADVAKSLIVQQPATTEGQESQALRREFAQGICAALIEHYYFAKARQPLLCEGKFVSLDEARKWQSFVEKTMHSSLTRLADKLVNSPTAQALKPPIES